LTHPRQLSPAERRVLWYQAHGVTDTRAAELMQRSPATIAAYRTNAYISLGVHTAPAAVHVAYSTNLIPLPQDPDGPPPDPVTPREWQILVQLAGGGTITTMADQLKLAETTVKTHMSRLYRRLGARSGAHAVGIGHRERLLSCCPTCGLSRIEAS